MRIKNILIGLLLVECGALTAQQQVQQMYFLENAPQRHYLNPAFQLYSNTYVSLPVIGNFMTSAENNSLRMSDIVYEKDGKVGYALTPGFDGRDQLYNTLRKNLAVGEDTRLEWLAFGHRGKKGGYWHVGLSTRMTSDITVPRDLFQMLLYGTEYDNPNLEQEKTFQLKTLGINASIYSELAVGYSKPLKNDKWTLGGAVKLLVGHENLSAKAQNLTLNTGLDRWVLDGQVDAKGTMPGEVMANAVDKLRYDDEGVTLTDYLKPKGYGAALDFGFTFDPYKWMQVSGAVTDLGGIVWCQDLQHIRFTANQIVYDGVDAQNVGKNTEVSDLLDDEWKRIQDEVQYETLSKQVYFRMLNAHLNAAVDFHTPNNLIGLGLLSTTKLMGGRVYEDVTASVNLRPCNWFNLSVSHSLVNLKQSCLGAGIALRGGPFNLTLATDYVPLDYARTSAGSAAYIPYRQKGVNVQVGLTLVFGNRHDQDRDGVKDKFDLCPNTPKGVAVDSVGCPLDEDKDGVPDYLDQCPGTPREAKVDSLGCPIDTDQDGVADYLDKCPGTPSGVKVDANGCPLDEDKDGVPDYRDQCPETPVGAPVDSVGCLLDSDGDGVADYLDMCPGTPAGAPVDSIGCPTDADKDGVPDYMDQCPNTPDNIRVDSVGCPMDTDGDGFTDDVDECPNVPGTDKGCPQVTKEVRNLFKKAMQGIQFETSKATILKSSNKVLDQIAKVFLDNPTYMVEVQGYTDNLGDEALNKRLSQERADAVREYLIKKGVPANRLKAVGYGPEKPIADNKTKAGRALNRRVEFEISFEEISYETETIKE